ncbi:MAG: hypothetical protein IKP12_02635 [Acholeplasmatales bacterium]|nr:hypothetical protein [Acholeplasmatales bacterium]
MLFTARETKRINGYKTTTTVTTDDPNVAKKLVGYQEPTFTMKNDVKKPTEKKKPEAKKLQAPKKEKAKTSKPKTSKKKPKMSQ